MEVKETVLTSRIDLLNISKEELHLIKSGLHTFAERDFFYQRTQSLQSKMASELIEKLEGVK